MVELTTCERCKKDGWRKLERKAPPGWFYMLVAIEHPPEGKPAMVYVYACSRTCAMQLWEEGPGPVGPAVVYEPHRARST